MRRIHKYSILGQLREPRRHLSPHASSCQKREHDILGPCEGDGRVATEAAFAHGLVERGEEGSASRASGEHKEDTPRVDVPEDAQSATRPTRHPDLLRVVHIHETVHVHKNRRVTVAKAWTVAYNKLVADALDR